MFNFIFLHFSSSKAVQALQTRIGSLFKMVQLRNKREIDLIRDRSTDERPTKRRRRFTVPKSPPASAVGNYRDVENFREQWNAWRDFQKKYVIIKKLGEGKAAAVYAVTSKQDARRLAGLPNTEAGQLRRERAKRDLRILAAKFIGGPTHEAEIEEAV